MELSLPQIHEDHVAGEGFTSMTHHNLVHMFILMPQAMKIPDAKAAVDKEWKKLETIPAWQLEKVKSKKEVILEAQRDKKVRFATLMDVCHLKNAELEPKLQKYKDRVVFRGDIVIDDSGAHAAFTEQGSSASHMTPPKVMDLIARLPDCDGRVADAISAYTQVTLEDTSRLLKIPKSECPDVWIRLPRHKWPKSWANIEDPVVLLERHLYGHPLAGPLCERQFEEVLSEPWMGKKYRIGNVWLFIENKDYSYRKKWNDFKMAGQKQNMAPLWKKLMKNVELDEPTTFLDHVYWDALNVNANRMKSLRNIHKMFESLISAGATEKLPG